MPRYTNLDEDDFTSSPFRCACRQLFSVLESRAYNSDGGYDGDDDDDDVDDDDDDDDDDVDNNDDNSSGERSVLGESVKLIRRSGH